MLSPRSLRYPLLAMSTMVVACVQPQSQAEPSHPDLETVRTLAQGELIGTRGRDNALAWYGIPYAKAPVGDLRWRAPRPPEEWKGRFSALDNSSRCFQIAGDNEPGLEAGEYAGSEDCLHLNVWAPSKPSPTPLPVMMWIHGGGNVWGYAGQYELGRLAESQNVVVVAINYRLGPLGWFAHSAIRDDAETALDSSANFATLDIIEALTWTQQNIDVFGGDPDNITVFGESAGGFNIASLMVSPQARGKFQKAIIQSGGFGSVSMQVAEFGPDDGEVKRGVPSAEIVAALIPSAGTQSVEETAAELRAISSEQLYDAYLAAQDEPNPMGGVSSADIIEDGIVIPIEGVEARLDSGQGIADVPVILGTNRDEVLGVSFLDDAMMNNFGILAYWPKDPDLYQAVGEYANRIWRALAVEAPAAKLHAHGHRDIYTYRFDWDEQGKALFTDISKLIGAHHALEIAFVTGGFDDQVNDKMGLSFKRHNRAGREALSSAMMSYWAHFAYSGDPARGRSGDLPQWQAWSPGEAAPKTILFDTKRDSGIRMTMQSEDYSDLVAQISNEPRLSSDDERCRVVKTAKFVMTSMTKDHTLIDQSIMDFCQTADSDEVD